MLDVPLAVALLTVVLVAAVTSAPLPEALVAPACVACHVDGEHITQSYSTDEWKALTAGKVLTAKVANEEAHKDQQGTVQAMGIIEHSPSRVWATLVDFASRPLFQPGTKEARVVQVDGNRAWVAEHLRFFLVDIRYTVINTLDPAGGTMRWVLDESVAHDIGGSRGSWQLTPIADGRHTLLTYRAWIDTGRHLPRFVEQFLLQQSLPNAIKGIRDEVTRVSRNAR
jgi:uncharacterized protein YndB with AHSA1/START domain